MKILRQRTSPNHTPVEITVDFVVLHYTATTLDRTLKIFMDPERKASAHLVIDRNGDVYEVVPCLESPALRAWHAGVSRLLVIPPDASTEVSTPTKPTDLIEGFNDRAIGIELVNVNGNVWPYTDAQYTALIACLELLQARYKALQRPSSVVGHEDVAGFRGKADPGRLFDWERLGRAVFPGYPVVRGKPRCSEALSRKLGVLYEKLGVKMDPSTGAFVGPGVASPEVFEALSSVMEAALADTG
jgi:N-acetylmuramoyl-L-alanine amidase